jgi:predicted nucleic acid-binding protein
VLVDEPDHASVLSAVVKLESNGEELCCTAQSLREFWHVGTRSVESNGIGLLPADVASLIAEIRLRLTTLSENDQTFEQWLKLVTKCSIRGAACHDANHVAVALAHGVDTVLTFDIAHFRNTGVAELTYLRPQDV